MLTEIEKEVSTSIPNVSHVSRLITESNPNEPMSEKPQILDEVVIEEVVSMACVGCTEILTPSLSAGKARASERVRGVGSRRSPHLIPLPAAGEERVRRRAVAAGVQTRPTLLLKQRLVMEHVRWAS